MGRIVDRTKSYLPMSWAAMAEEPDIGEATLVARIEYIESLIFGSVLDDAAEGALDVLVVEYVAKGSALQIADQAIEFWMMKKETVTTTGTAEVASFPEKLKSLQELKKSLLADIASLEPIVIPLIPNLNTRRSASAPLLSSINDEMQTPDVRDFGPMYAPLET